MIHSSLTQYTDLNRYSEFYISDDTITTLMLTQATTACSQAEFSQDDRIPSLEHLGVSDGCG